MRNGSSPANGPLLDVQGLSVSFYRGGDRRTVVTAVDDVSFRIARTEIFTLVGESGSGKTSICRVLAGLQRPSGGVMTLDGRPVWPRQRRGESSVPPGAIGMVFQNAQESLDPRQRVSAAIGEALATARRPGSVAAGAAEFIAMVGLPESSLSARARELSGGQAQRVALARSLATQPRLLLLDEPVSALDVSLQAQMLNLLRTIQRTLQIAYLFVTHDLAVARQLADTVGVMFAGRIVEYGPRDSIFTRPQHPYTQQPLAAAPRRDSSASRRAPADSGEPPIPLAGPAPASREGCGYVSRCQLWQQLGKPTRCLEERPLGTARDDAGAHHALCHYPGDHRPDLLPAATGSR